MTNEEKTPTAGAVEPESDIVLNERQVLEAVPALLTEIFAAAELLQINERQAQREALRSVLMFLIEIAPKAYKARQPLVLLRAEMLQKERGWKKDALLWAAHIHAAAIIHAAVSAGIDEDIALARVVTVLDKYKMPIGRRKAGDRLDKSNKKSLKNLLENLLTEGKESEDHRRLFDQHVSLFRAWVKALRDLGEAAREDLLEGMAGELDQSLARRPVRPEARS
jgi:uncharacterized membrane protein